MSHHAPTPTNPNADGWCPGEYIVKWANTQDLYGPTVAARLPFPLSRLAGEDVVGYRKDVVVSCPSLHETRMISKEYYFSSSNDADHNAVLRITYENTSEVTEKE